MPRSRKQAVRAEEAARLRRLRTATGLAQRDLAEAFNVTSGAIAQWEGAVRTIPGPVLRLMELYEHELGILPPSERRAPRTPTGWLSRNVAHARAAAFLLLFHGLDSVVPSSVGRRLRDAAVANFAQALAELKGLSMKFGQASGYMDLVLPEEHQRVLRSIEQLSTPMPALAVVSTFLADLGQPPRSLFREWSPEPVAVASIGQVHRAVLASGAKVAVKVQHPKVAEMLEADLRNLSAIDRGLAIVSPAQTPRVLYEEARSHFLGECDYRLEARHTTAFRDAFRARRDIFVPEVIESHSAQRILTTTWAPGVRFDEFLARASQAERDRAGATIWDFHHESILRDGRFNTDPHPGNYLFGDGVVSFLDFGRVKVFPKDFLAASGRMVRTLFERDLAGYREALIALGCVPAPDQFDFHYSFRAMLLFYSPCLVDEPFQFTREFVARMWKAFGSGNVNRARTNYPADMSFMHQLFFGVGALLARLGARVACRPGMLDLLYREGQPRPPPATRRELDALAP